MSGLVRGLGYFRPDWPRVSVCLGLLVVSIGLNLLKPWPLAILVDSVLGSKAFPSWVPAEMTHWQPTGQLTVLIGVSLLLHLAHAATCGGHVYLSINIGLRGLRRVRDEVFGWLQRLSLRFHHGTQAGDIIFRAGNDTTAFQTLFQQGFLISLSAVATLGFMLVAMLRLNPRLALVALAAIPVLLLAIKVFGRAMRARGVVAQEAEAGHRGRDPDPRRLRLHPRVPRRALAPRRQDPHDLRRHERDPAARHRPGDIRPAYRVDRLSVTPRSAVEPILGIHP